MTRLTGSHMVRVAVLSDKRITEIALPTSLPIRDILPALEHLIIDPDSATLDAHPKLSLSHTGGVPFSLDANLDTLGVIDGDLLTLCAIPTGPPATGVVEDIADATAILSTKNSLAWENKIIHTFALGTITAFFVIAVASLTFHLFFLTVHPASNYNQPAEIMLLILTALQMALSLFYRNRNTVISAILSFIVIFSLATAMFFLVPEENGIVGQYAYDKIPCFMLAAASVMSWSLLYIIVAKKLIATHTAIIILTGTITVYLIIESSVRFGLAIIGSTLIILAVALTIKAASLSSILARLSIAALPAPGDPIPPAPSLQYLSSLPERVKIACSHQNGFIAAATIIGAFGCTLLVQLMHNASLSHRCICWTLIVSFILGCILRSRIWVSSITRLWLLSTPFIFYFMVIIMFFYTKNFSQIFWALGAFAISMTILFVLTSLPSLLKPQSYSLLMRRMLVLSCSVLDVVIVPCTAYLTGFFTAILNR